jgi:hypothetical protein
MVKFNASAMGQILRAAAGKTGSSMHVDFKCLVLNRFFLISQRIVFVKFKSRDDPDVRLKPETRNLLIRHRNRVDGLHFCLESGHNLGRVIFF